MLRLHHVPVVLILLGGVLLLGAAIQPRLSNPRNYWTQTEADAHAHSGSEYHALAHKLGHAHTEAEKKGLVEQLEKAKTHYHESDAALQSARDRHAWPSRLMRWSGFICVGLGIVGYYISRARGG